MKFNKNVIQVNIHRLMESDFQYDVIISTWRPWHHFTQKCHHLASSYEASVHEHTYAAVYASSW